MTKRKRRKLEAAGWVIGDADDFLNTLPWDTSRDVDSNVFDPAQRAKEKSASRAEDQRALDSGEKTKEQLSAENGVFTFPRDRIVVHYPKREK